MNERGGVKCLVVDGGAALLDFGGSRPRTVSCCDVSGSYIKL